MFRTTLVAEIIGKFVWALVLFTLVFSVISAVVDTDNTVIYIFPITGLVHGFLFLTVSCLGQIAACLLYPRARPLMVLPSWVNVPFMTAMTRLLSLRHAVHFSSAIHGEDASCICCGKPVKGGGGGIFFCQVSLVGKSSSYGMVMASIHVFIHMDCRNGPGFRYVQSACSEIVNTYNGTSLNFEHFLLDDPCVKQLPTSKSERLDEGVRSVIRLAGDYSPYHGKMAANCIILCNRLKDDKTLGAAI